MCETFCVTKPASVDTSLWITVTGDSRSAMTADQWWIVTGVSEGFP